MAHTHLPHTSIPSPCSSGEAHLAIISTIFTLTSTSTSLTTSNVSKYLHTHTHTHTSQMILREGGGEGGVSTYSHASSSVRWSLLRARWDHTV